MRRGASLMASLEGMSMQAYRIATELAGNTRSGLTVRFLAKKLEIPPEEVEYLLDVHDRLFFSDLTKVKVVAEGHGMVKRIAEGLECRGDIPSLVERVKSYSPNDFRRLEEQIGFDEPCTKRMAVDEIIQRYYGTPEALLTYVGAGDFSEVARELFDIVWQSKDGVLPVSQIQASHGGSEYEIEQGLTELFEGFALFEMFRFDTEDRLVRVAGLLKELRPFRTAAGSASPDRSRLKPLRGKPDSIESRELQFSDTICRLVAAVAARPVRLRSDGELFREDRRRLAAICPEDIEPSLNTCLWVAEGAGWLVRVDNTLRAGELESLIGLDRVRRHQRLCDWLLEKGDDVTARALLREFLDEVKPGAWYAMDDFVSTVMQWKEEEEQLVLRQLNGQWKYVNPNASEQARSRLARALEETFFWLGFVDRGTKDGERVFRLSDVGDALLRSAIPESLAARFPRRKGEFVVQPNFDIVVPAEDMDPLLTVPLDQFSERGSTGQATVYNVSRESFTQAVQEGHDAGAFVEFLLAHNRGGSLPANVMTTLEDWRGAMKQVRLKTIHVIESDDPLVMADLVHRRKFEKYLRHLDGRHTVSYGGIDRDELVRALEKEGFIVE
ncbi:MAG: helicase-associated domain-containing protein [Candidatus Hydrogenedentes bacterium]|nr:helicase-associated domain-containing protein [Candidatus Hydrogenedentota bacterium]